MIDYLFYSSEMTFPPVLVDPSLIILVCSKSLVSIHLLRVKELVRLTYQIFHAPHVIAAQGQLYVLISYS